MRNDEKIDINLTQDTAQDLSEEELAQQNYDTALRYINIAEHMKQFEDQGKYYHKAIKYLRLARPYIEVRQLILETRKKKFSTRAEGKITLYEEACKIRDHAKLPNDYYSAQSLFTRIHQFELTHPVPENKVSPELFERVSECCDSEEQADICGKLGAQKAASIKRHSLLVSSVVIVILIALLFSTRTSGFRRALASVYEVTGDDTGAWEAYDYIYEHTGEQDSFDKYLTYRYKAAEKALKKGNTDTAYTDFKALAKEDYKDSQEQFIALEQSNISKGEPGKIVHFAAMDWRVLEKQEDKVLLLKDNALGNTPFNEGGGNTTWETSSLRTWLNGSYLTENFYEGEQAIILNTDVTAESNPLYKTDAGNSTTDQLFLLSSEEVEHYRDNIHTTKTCWWLRTPGAHPNSMSFVYKDKTVMDYGYDTANTNITVKPAIWVSIK